MELIYLNNIFESDSNSESSLDFNINDLETNDINTSNNSENSDENEESSKESIDNDILVISNKISNSKVKLEMKKQIWKKREYIYCNNCGKYGHVYKKCYESILSYGIICINLKNQSIYDFYISKYKFPDNIQQLKNICVNKYIQKNINCNNRKDLDLYQNKIINNTEYLMVRRKFTYNYIYIIRGMYDLNLEMIIKSINLLTKSEYEKIVSSNFDDLWTDIWGKNGFKTNFLNEYNHAKEQMRFLRNYILPQISHKINITFDHPEWGFPKGKRNNDETNLECAKREFEEETGLTEENYVLLDRLYPLVENIKGSNGINYKHVYYIALFNKNTDLNNIKIDKSKPNYEIGDIGLYNINNSMELLRDYNIERKELINNLKLFFTYNTRYYEKFYHNRV